MKKMNTTEVKFECPNCEGKYSLNEFLEHNSDAWNDYINQKTQQELKLREGEIRQDEVSKQEQVLKIELNKIQQKHQQDLQQNQAEITELKHQLVQENQAQALVVEQTKNQYQDEIKNYQVQIQKLTLEQETQLKLNQEKINTLRVASEQEKSGAIKLLNQQIESLKKELLDQKHQQDLLVKTEKQTIEQQYQEQINNQKAEIQRLKQAQASQIELTKAQLEAQKAAAVQEKDNAVQLLNHQLEALRLKQTNEIKTALQTKEIELSEKIHQLEKEKSALILKNNENRLINNKIKGENFEHEVEGELRKSFGFSDQIEKITDVDKKADYLQIVRNEQKKELGRIVYEVKNAEWSDRWEAKLVEDTAKQKAKYGILVATKFNDKYHDVPFVKSAANDNIYLTDADSFIFVAQILRKMMENENYYHQKVKELSANQQDALFSKYKQNHEMLVRFFEQKLPEFKKKFETQLEAILKVGTNLNKQADILEKAHNSLKKEYTKRIAEELQKISTI